MSKEKPTKKKPSKERDPLLGIRIDPALEAAIDAFIAGQRVPPDKSEVGRTALREFLEREGFWPWPKPPEKT